MRTRLAATRFPFATGIQGALQMMTKMTAVPGWRAGIKNGFDTGVQSHEF